MKKSPDLHGNAPDKSSVALLMIDVINDFEFEGAEALFAQALPAAGTIATLKKRADAVGVPTIYANDNFGKWRSDFRTLRTASTMTRADARLLSCSSRVQRIISCSSQSSPVSIPRRSISC